MMRHSLKFLLTLVTAIVLATGCLHTTEVSVESMVAKWGTGDPEHDREVVDNITTSTNGVRSWDMDPELLNAVVRKVQKRPDLLRQIFGKAREWSWVDGDCNSRRDTHFFLPLICDMETSCPAKFEAAGACSRTGRACLNIIMLAGMFDRPDWLIGLEWTNALDHFDEIAAWIKENAHFIVFDHEKQAYVVDKAAREAGIPVDPLRQKCVKCP